MVVQYFIPSLKKDTALTAPFFVVAVVFEVLLQFIWSVREYHEKD